MSDEIKSENFEKENSVLLIDYPHYVKDLTPEGRSSSAFKKSHFRYHVFEIIREMQITYQQVQNLTEASSILRQRTFKMIVIFCIDNGSYHRAAIFFNQIEKEKHPDLVKVIMIGHVSVLDGKTPSDVMILNIEDESGFQSLFKKNRKKSNLKELKSVITKKLETNLNQYKHLIKPDYFRRSGDVLNNRYKLIGFMGSGGMGWVYLAENLKPRKNDRFVAVKILNPDVIARNPKNIRLFENEFKAATKLKHPNIVKISDSGVDQKHNAFYMVMEVIDGISLDTYLSEKRMPLDVTTQIFRQICDAVQYAHSKNVLHLDIKPANILLEKVNNIYNVKIIDFGMSKVVESESGTTVTQFGGTPLFCSPEHFGGKLTNKSDIYSLGSTLYYMLAGVAPFGGSYIFAKQNPNWEMPPLPLLSRQCPDLPKGIDSFIQKALSKNPLERHQTVEQLLQDFQNVLNGLPAALALNQSENGFNEVNSQVGVSINQAKILYFLISYDKNSFGVGDFGTNLDSFQAVAESIQDLVKRGFISIGKPFRETSSGEDKINLIPNCQLTKAGEDVVDKLNGEFLYSKGNYLLDEWQ